MVSPSFQPKRTVRFSEVKRENRNRTLFFFSLDQIPMREIVEFYIEHEDMEIQQVGQRALAMVSEACGINMLNGCDEFIGKTMLISDFNEIKKMALRQVPEIFTSNQCERPLRPSINVVQPTSQDARFVYVISADAAEQLCKIGIAGSPEKRLKQLSTSSPHPLRLELTRHSDNATAVERAAHSHFSNQRRNGEWFAMSPDLAIQYIIDATKKAA